MFRFKKKKQKKDSKLHIGDVSNSLTPPKGWYVQQAFQNPLHMLWDVVLVSFDDVCDKVDKPRHYIATEKDTYQQALQECIDNCC